MFIGSGYTGVKGNRVVPVAVQCTQQTFAYIDLHVHVERENWIVWLLIILYSLCASEITGRTPTPWMILDSRTT